MDRIQREGILLAKKAVSHNSVSGFPADWEQAISGENRVAGEFIDYFHNNGIEAFTQDVPHPEGDHLPPRQNVWAVIPGESSDTLVISGHIDTVPLNQPQQIDPDAEIARIAELTGQKPEDIIAGRGSLDMKGPLAGAAATAVEAHRANLFKGTIVIAGYVDEETGSAGAIKGLEQLIRFQEERGLKIKGIVDVDFTSPEYPGHDEHPLYEGTIGKYCPFMYVQTGTTHVGSPERSLNAQTVLDRINVAVGNNCNFADEQQGTITPPPTILFSRTLRDSYSVQTPPQAGSYANYFTIGAHPDEVLHGIKDVMIDAFDDANRNNQRLISRRIARGELPPDFVDQIDPPQVYTFAELITTLRSNGVEQEEMDALIAETDATQDSRLRSLDIAASLVNKLNRPGANIAVVGFAPPYYPYRKPRESSFSHAVREASLIAGQNGDFPTAVRAFFPYISDLSWIGIDPEVIADLPAIEANMPLWNKPGGFSMPIELMQKLDVEVVNSGGRGVDAHGPNEHASIESTFRRNPQVILEILRQLNESL